MTRALDCFGYCIQVDYLPMLELRLEKVTNSVLMICNMIPWMSKSGLAVMVYA